MHKVRALLALEVVRPDLQYIAEEVRRPPAVDDVELFVFDQAEQLAVEVDICQALQIRAGVVDKVVALGAQIHLGFIDDGCVSYFAGLCKRVESALLHIEGLRPLHGQPAHEVLRNAEVEHPLFSLAGWVGPREHRFCAHDVHLVPVRACDVSEVVAFNYALAREAGGLVIPLKEESLCLELGGDVDGLRTNERKYGRQDADRKHSVIKLLN